MNRHERECLANALLQIQNVRFRLGCVELQMPAGAYHAIANRLAEAEVDLRSIARSVSQRDSADDVLRESFRSAETDAPQEGGR